MTESEFPFYLPGRGRRVGVKHCKLLKGNELQIFKVWNNLPKPLIGSSQCLEALLPREGSWLGQEQVNPNEQLDSVRVRVPYSSVELELRKEKAQVKWSTCIQIRAQSASPVSLNQLFNVWILLPPAAQQGQYSRVT